MAFVVVYDACVLYPNTVRDLLIRIHQAGLVQAKWTDAILDETFAALRRRRADIDDDQLDRLRRLMVRAVPDCFVTKYEPLVDGLELPDPGDRHGLAAAIRAARSCGSRTRGRTRPRVSTTSWPTSNAVGSSSRWLR